METTVGVFIATGSLSAVQETVVEAIPQPTSFLGVTRKYYIEFDVKTVALV